MDIHSEEKQAKDLLRARAIIKYQEHFRSIEIRNSVICSTAGLISLGASMKYS